MRTYILNFRKRVRIVILDISEIKSHGIHKFLLIFQVKLFDMNGGIIMEYVN